MFWRKEKSLKVSLVLFLLFSILTTLAFSQALAITRPVVEGKNGMVASAHPLASQVGVEILKKGGNAIDAAVATAFTLGVVEPQASGLGGGGFILIRFAKTGEVVAIDYRERAPLKARADMYPLTPEGKVKDDLSTIGHLAVAVPGTLAGLTLALEKYGTLKLKEVMEPAIKLAENGYEVSRTMNALMKDNFDKISRFPATAKVYLKEGLPYEIGDKIVLKDLANTYKKIAEKGPDVFYKGEIADAIVKEMEAGKGIITKEDLLSYSPVRRTPVRGSYRGYEIISMSPPSSGGTHIIQLLNILEGFNMAELGHNSAPSIHLMAEAMKKIFADRAKYMGDPDYYLVPVKGLTSKKYAEELRREIDLKAPRFKVPAGIPYPYEAQSTSHLSVADKEGNLVALTQTINYFFGSGVLVPGTGILLNNEMDDFDPVPGRANSIAPGKRPLSSMSPTLILKEGKPIMSVGTPGATRIITALAQIIMNIVDYKMNIQEAIEAPRLHCMTAEIAMESRLPETVRKVLEGMGHKISVRKEFDLYFGGAQGIVIDPTTGTLLGGADPRRDGVAIGY